jgi:hypothetical protein
MEHAVTAITARKAFFYDLSLKKVKERVAVDLKSKILHKTPKLVV